MRGKAIVLAMLCVSSLSGCAGKTQHALAAKVVALGTDFATSGADASAGVPTQNGVVLAVFEESKRPLPGGYELTLKTLDDTVNGIHDPAQGARNMQSLVHDSTVLAIIGPTHSNVARAEIPIANEAKIALISPSSTSIGLTDDGAGARQLRSRSPGLHNFFRTVLRDDLQGAADADFAFATLHARRAYVVDDNESYGKGLADVFVGAFRRAGGTVVERTHLTKGQQDFIAMLTRLQSFSPDIVYYGGVVSTGGAQLRRQMVKLGIGAKFMGGDGLKEEGYISAAGPAGEGTYCSDGAPNLDALPTAGEFLRTYRARFPGQPIGTYSANAYAAAQVAIEAIRRVMESNGGRPPSREELIGEIAHSTTTRTPLGDVSFTPQGDITTPVVSMWIVHDGRFKFLGQQKKELATQTYGR